ncbi:hypothetical protein [Streptomyces cyaneogriseus]|uniref:hypothetical protein n=1 Tax=Streptomyces cyaneogriseus TaxID=68192 RepID=UPI00099CE5C5|nr:hypothetical protein [Streptomyces cyaneogriseus]
MSSVAVLVEPVRGGTAGAHVKCWERFARSAARLPRAAPPGDGGPGGRGLGRPAETVAGRPADGTPRGSP